MRSATWNSAIWSVSHNHGIWPVWRSIMVLVHERSIDFVWRCKWVRTALRYDITITVSFVSFKIKFQNIVWFCFKWSCWRPWFYHRNFLYCSIVVVKVLNTLILQSFSSWDRENSVNYVPKFTKNRWIKVSPKFHAIRYLSGLSSHTTSLFLNKGRRHHLQTLFLLFKFVTSEIKECFV